MIFNIGWLALTFIWLSGLLAGRGVAMIYDGVDLWPAYIATSMLVLAGVLIRVRVRS